VWLPPDRTRTYGPLLQCLANDLAIHNVGDRNPLIIHPQPPAAHKRLQEEFGTDQLHHVAVTPTSSYRSVLAMADGLPPFVVKLSLGVKVAGIRRALIERKLASSIMMSTILGTIPQKNREAFRFDWFPEPAGLVETTSECGWLLRRFPEFDHLIPAFSLTAERDEQHPLLVEWIHRSGASPETFILDQIIRPYVRLLAYLMFEEGLQVEGHAQNVLFETNAEESLTGRILLRDLADFTVNIPLRVARRKPLPVFGSEFASSKPPFPLATVVSDHQWNRKRPWIMRARDTIERYGLGAFLGTIHPVVARYFPEYDRLAVEAEYLRLWQQEAIRYLKVKPLFRDQPKGLAADEAVTYFLQNADWKSIGSSPGASLPAKAEPLLIDHRERRRTGPVYDRVQCEWGDLYLSDRLPVFFDPAF